MQQNDPISNANISSKAYSGKLPTAILIGGVLIAFALSYLIAAPFLPAIVWSVTLAVLFVPLEARIRKLVRIQNLAAGISVLVVAFIVVIPFMLVAGTLVNQAIGGATLIASMFNAETWSRLSAENPLLFSISNRINEWIDLPQIVQNATSSLTNWSGDLLRGSIASLATMLVTFYFLFYLLRDWPHALSILEENLPLSADEFSTLANRVSDTVFASVYGTAVVSALQGVLGGLMFWWLDLPSPIFWGILMGALAVVPFLGAFVIWVPAAIFLLLDGEVESALILTLWGTIVVGLVDNVIYPILVGNRLKLHSVPSFVAILGGLLLFGLSGIVLGPVIIVVAPTLFNILRGRMQQRTVEAD